MAPKIQLPFHLPQPMTRSRYRVLQNSSPHFLTATINHWLPLFTRPATVNIVLDSWRFLQLVGWVEATPKPIKIKATRPNPIDGFR
ncbi:hypothetical protein NP603_08820 [Methylomonas sp. SURF-1]|uniref:Uncharacterized protein n=1 Tax=Methylomonas aurea TaxID=2952224 RepID=A0ABT1UG53_9GAMM|nr:hypothetical protein [Methylomonas sp. SURF-1]MCQ8181209.1 hypothetical protein [Methylomonas sp. SURF-1]